MARKRSFRRLVRKNRHDVDTSMPKKKPNVVRRNLLNAAVIKTRRIEVPQIVRRRSVPVALPAAVIASPQVARINVAGVRPNVTKNAPASVAVRSRDAAIKIEAIPDDRSLNSAMANGSHCQERPNSKKAGRKRKHGGGTMRPDFVPWCEVVYGARR